MLIKLFLLSLLSVSINSNVCTPNAGTYVILTEDDLYEINNCTNINGNLFIHGGINVKEIQDLELLLVQNIHI
mgnify:CR=1 FL=1